jgi:DNA polymerase-4
LPLEILPGIGKKTLPQMHKEGWLTIGDIQQAGCEVLMERFGGWGYQLYNSSMGHDNRPVQWEERPPKSLGAEETFESDIGDLETLQAALKRLCDKVWSRLQAHKMRARSLQIKLRYASFRTVTRSHTFDRHINDWEEISTAAKRLLSLHRDPSEPLRLVGIALDKLTSGYWQPLLWE